jgi:hypothetical protein
MECDSDFLAGIGPTPDVDWPVALQHHMTAENPRQPDFALSIAWVAGQQEGEGENAKGYVDGHKYILKQRASLYMDMRRIVPWKCLPEPARA